MKRYVNAARLKRLGAFILDFFLIILGATILFLGFMEVFSNSTLMKEANEKINAIQIESYLYKLDEKTGFTKIVDEKEYEIAIKNFYCEYKDDSALYHEKMTESELFIYENGTYYKKENIKEEDVKIFYQELMGEAILEIKNNEDYKKCSDIIINCELYCVAVSILVSYIIFIILIPIIRKNKNIIWHVVMNLKLVNIDGYGKPTNTQIIFRAIIILITEVYLATYCYGATIIVSFAMIIFRKDNSSYHDLLSSTIMIDNHYIELDDQINFNKEG